MKNVFREVHTRSLWQVLGLYLAVSWVVLQVVDVLADNVALPDWVFPIALVLLLVGLPVVLGTAFVQGGVGKTDPEPEPAGGEGADPHEAALVPPAPARSGLLTWRNAFLGGVAAFGLLGLGIGGWVGLRAAGIGGAGTLVAKGMLDDRAEVVISDFLASGAEPSLARTLTEAFRIDFTESPTVRVVDPSRVSETLRLMEQDPEEGLTLDLARELAQREGFPAVIAGEIGMAGANYLLTGQVVSAADGAVLVSHRETASEEDLLDAIDDLSQRLRERIGEPLGSLAGAAPLERVTTSSFEALDKYSEAERLMITGGSRTRAVSLLEEAIELDSTFAMAHRKLGISLFILGEQRARQVESFTRAFELRERLTDYERYITEGSYYTFATGERDRAVTAYENALAIDSVGAALNNLAIVYQALGDHERALEMFELDIMQDRLSSNPYVNSLFSFASLGRPDDMRARFDEMYGLFPTTSSHSWGAQAFLSVGDYEAADAHIASLEVETGSPDWQSQARLLGAMSRGARGNLGEGLQLLTERAEIEADRELAGGVWESHEFAARMLLGVRGDAEAALARLDQAAAAAPVDELSAYDRPYSVLAVANAEAGRVAEARRYAEAFEEEIWPLASGDLGVRLQYRMARGAVAEAEGDFEAAIEEYRQTPEPWCPECTSRLLGRAFDRWGQADSALVYLERAASTPSGSRAYGDFDWIGRTTLRVAQLHDQANNLSDAARFYAAFVELWADADAEFQPEVAAAQRRLEEILGEIG